MPFGPPPSPSFPAPQGGRKGGGRGGGLADDRWYTHLIYLLAAALDYPTKDFIKGLMHYNKTDFREDQNHTFFNLEAESGTRF